MEPELEQEREAARADVTGERFRSLRRLIGDTPLLAIRCDFRGRAITVYAKHEIRNFTGSIKDRMALRILEDAYADGSVRPGDVIVEATSGNTGISFAAVGRALGHDVRIYMPDWMSRERALVIESLGATVVSIAREQGGFRGCIDGAEAFAREHERTFLPRQFESPGNVRAHHDTTGPELLRQLRSLGREPTAFVAGVGTGGRVMGVGACLRAALGAVAIHPLEPANSPTLRTGCKVGTHRIQGISDEFIPPIVQLDELDPIVDVWDGDAILAAQMLAARLGLGVGISSGANLLGALQVAWDQGADAAVATVFPDSHKKYISTALCGHEAMRSHYDSRQLELLGCRVAS